MTGFCAGLRRLAAINLLGAVALLATIAMGALLKHQGHDLLTQFAPWRILSLEFAFTAENAQNIITSWGGVRHEIAVHQILADFFFIISYAWLALYVGFKAAGRAERRGRPGLAKSARIAGFAGLVAGACDCVENAGMLLMLAGNVKPGIALATSLAASTKIVLLALGLLVAFIAAVWPSAPVAVPQPVAGPSNADPIPPAPEKGCDVIMKGGITSGVVYPRAIFELSKEYHFVNLGGTSAGAIAAAVAAAAEYGRAKGGFTRIAEIPKELGENLLKLFQPSPSVKPLFDILIAALGAKPKPGTPPKTGADAAIAKIEIVDRIVTAICNGYPCWALGGALLGFVIFVIATSCGYAGWAAFGVLMLVVGLIASLGWRLKAAALNDLKQNDYGLCTGATQDEAAYGHKALTEWLADTIDECAGLKARNKAGGDPLTFGQLKNPPHGKAINLAMMTTNLSMRRPYKIPFHDKTLLYREADIRRLMPARVADYMIAHSDIVADDGKKGAEGEPAPVEVFRHLPDEDHFPVVLGARLSLSFPILFTAIPLYTRDFSLITDEDRREPRRCYFSDGGLSNNFPIQFFDRLWPNGPTFAIGLEEFDPARNKKPVWMPKPVDDNGRPITSGALLSVEAIDGLPGFLTGILYAAKDWQDNLQSTLIGYRERIVHVALKSDEGGLNLTMPKETIDALSAYGQEAGNELNTKFDLDDHRWRRFLVAMTRLEMTLFDLQDAHDHAPAGAESFGAFLKRYPPNAIVYRHDAAWLTEASQRVDKLVRLATDWRAKPMFQKNGIPSAHTDLRITPKP